MNNSENKKTDGYFPWKELLAFLGVILAAYIGYLGVRSQIEIPIQATQTAEVKLLESTKVVTPAITVSPIFVLDVALGSKFIESENKYRYVVVMQNAGSKSVDDISIIIKSKTEYPLLNCGSSLVPYGNLLPSPRQLQQTGFYTVIYDIPTLSPSAMVSITCENTDWGMSFQEKYNISPEKVINAHCEGSNDLSSVIPTIGIMARDITPSQIKYSCVSNE